MVEDTRSKGGFATSVNFIAPSPPKVCISSLYDRYDDAKIMYCNNNNSQHLAVCWRKKIHVKKSFRILWLTGTSGCFDSPTVLPPLRGKHLPENVLCMSFLSASVSNVCAL